MSFNKVDTDSRDAGSVGIGFLIGCLIQAPMLLGSLYFGFIFAMTPPDSRPLYLRVLAFVLAGQWLILVPLIRSAARNGEVQTGSGYLAAAAIGALLGTACGRVLYG